MNLAGLSKVLFTSPEEFLRKKSFLEKISSHRYSWTLDKNHKHLAKDYRQGWQMSVLRVQTIISKHLDCYKNRFSMRFFGNERKKFGPPTNFSRHVRFKCSLCVQRKFLKKTFRRESFFWIRANILWPSEKNSSTFVNFASQLPRGTFWPKTFQKQKKYIFNIFLGFEWKCFGIDKKFQHVVKNASYLSGQKCWWNFFPKNMFPWKISDFEEKTVSYWWLKSSTALSKVPFTNTVEVFQTKTFLQKV